MSKVGLLKYDCDTGEICFELKNSTAKALTALSAFAYLEMKISKGIESGEKENALTILNHLTTRDLEISPPMVKALIAKIK